MPNISKKIYQFDLDYNFIKEWKSMKEILDNNKEYKIGAISNNLNYISKSGYSHIWSYDENLTKPIINVTLTIDKKYFLDKDTYDYPDEKEYWKDIIGYETRYKISNHGNVFTYQLNRLMILQEKDYLRIKLYDSNNKKKMYYVHVLVAKHFIKNPTNLPKVDHIDEDKYNAHYKNLRWSTHSGNTQAYHDNKIQLEILQYSLDNKLVKEWKSIKDILESNKSYKRGSLTACLNGQRTKSYNFIWKYKNPPVKKEKKKNNVIIIDDVKEEWKNVGMIGDKNFPLYDVSNYGRVRNTKTDLILSPGFSTNGYHVVCLTDELGNTYMKKCHILTATRFCEGQSHIKNMANHLDEDILNNYYKNLEWTDNTGNITHSTGKKVNQIDISTGKIIRTFNSLAEATKIVNPNGSTSQMCIIKVCQNKKKTAFGYKWEYAT